MAKVAESLKQAVTEGIKTMIAAKKKCFAYNTEKNRCEALIWTYCMFEETCPFYKTKGQVEEEKKGKKTNE